MNHQTQHQIHKKQETCVYLKLFCHLLCACVCNEKCVEGRILKVQQLLEGAAFKIINDGQRGLAAAISWFLSNHRIFRNNDFCEIIFCSFYRNVVAFTEIIIGRYVWDGM